tara:strand:+ start:836 stop:970 length:135 start_codon:yes stop_codon:yes gene_type:complete
VDVAGIEPAFAKIYTQDLALAKSRPEQGTSRGPVLTSIMLYPRF